MIDICSNILSGGNVTNENIPDKSLELLRKAEKSGITLMIAAPYYIRENAESKKANMIKKIQMLNTMFASQNMHLEVHLGQIIPFFPELINDFHNKKLVTINDKRKYMLLEIPNEETIQNVESILYDLQVQGIVPILVHPEKNNMVMHNPSILYGFVKNGSLLLISANSITGALGKKVQKLALKLVFANLAHFISSDVHRQHEHKNHLKQAFHVVKKRFGVDLCDMFHYNAREMIANKDIYRLIPERIDKRPFFWFKVNNN